MTIGAYQYLLNTHKESIRVQKAFIKKYSKQIISTAKFISEKIKQGKKIIIMGNGGSCADASHLAAEFTGRLLTERDPLPAIALTTDTSAITAIGNDYGFEHVFDRQLYAIANEGDIVIAISTSGNSPNVLNAVKTALWKKCFVIGLTGKDGGDLKHLCDSCFIVDQGKNSCIIQETHEFFYHSLVDLIDRFFSAKVK